MNTLVLPIQALSQRNPVWANQTLGFGRVTLGTHGCAVTVLAMLLNCLNPHPDPSNSPNPLFYTPTTVNHALRAHDAFTGPLRNFVIDRRLETNLPVIAYVDAKLKEPGLQQHFVLIVGVEDAERGIYLINDPWFGDQALLCPRYGVTPAQAIAGLILFDPRSARDESSALRGFDRN
ncbi:MAG: hypothetical protein A2Z17_07145 [Gammaproteobacteria bacterium RBG_16_66_13]|nr:MAG: hypothetical protein A2Z17_07145 [Gammaproteobacteria bacterium RBG_16_66_13]